MDQWSSQNLISEIAKLFEADADRAWAHVSRCREKFGSYGEGLLKIFESSLSGYSSRNLTDWNYDYCFTFHFMCEPNIPMHRLSHDALLEQLRQLDRPLLQFVIDVSAVLPFYHCYFRTTRLVDAGCSIQHISQIVPDNANQLKIQETFSQTLSQLGYEAINSGVLSEHVPGVNCMDLIAPDDICVYDCLFHEGGPPQMGTFTEPFKR